jgi:gluconolactonase
VELQDVEVVAEGLAFPEGPTVMPDGSVVVVEMTAGRLTRIGGDGATSVLAETGGGPNGAAIGPDGALYVCNNGGLLGPVEAIAPCIQRVDPSTGDVEVLFTECDGAPLVAPNDIVFDDAGGFYFTDMYGNAVLYGSVDGTRIAKVLDDVPMANGVGIAPDGDRLVVALTSLRQVVARTIRAPGELVPSPGYSVTALVLTGAVDPAALVGGLPGAEEVDSLAVEADGTVCVGTLMAGCISAFRPSGDLEQYTLPTALADPLVTNIAFGGDDLQTAYLTASTTGRLLRCRWPRPGLRLPFTPGRPARSATA